MLLNFFVKKRFSVKKYSVKKHFINLTKHQNLVPIISKSESFDVEKSLCTRAAIFEPSGGITLKKRLDSVMEMTEWAQELHQKSLALSCKEEVM